MITNGWQLVPTRHEGRAGMTQEMCDTFWRTFHLVRQKHGNFESTNIAYNAMLAVAPVYSALSESAGHKQGEKR